jgi:hypothetical protein
MRMTCIVNVNGALEGTILGTVMVATLVLYRGTQ